MHENFLNCIMIGLSRGLFPSGSQPSHRFDEEAYLRQEAEFLRREKRIEAARQRRSMPGARTEATTESGSEEPGGRQQNAFWRRGVKAGDPRAGLAGSQPCRAA